MHVLSSAAAGDFLFRLLYNLINVLKQTHMMSMLALLGLSLASLHGFLSGSSLPAHGYCKSSMASASLVVETFRRTTPS
tara:strand:- start:280 stop:516 length:237 start_codon:yes stop_codon:yes gene_type:complete